MQSVILDTNVFVSALISKNSPPSLIVDELILNRKITLYTSDDIMAEYLEVLGRDKFARYPNFKSHAEILLSRLYEISTKFTPDIRLDIITDESDNRFLELAHTAQPDFLITGNINDFTMQTIGRTRIVAPRDYCDLYWPT